MKANKPSEISVEELLRTIKVLILIALLLFFILIIFSKSFLNFNGVSLSLSLQIITPIFLEKSTKKKGSESKNKTISFFKI